MRPPLKPFTATEWGILGDACGAWSATLLSGPHFKVTLSVLQNACYERMELAYENEAKPIDLNTAMGDG